ncbi:WD40 repeat-like protein [Mycena sanguinolenta]|uniref:WD40 repeat-like protein n=1 Tax=Mycena sanguinolenta TaxID=230812 RepID=A0A8H6X5E1_9AGAR|nr:WD40 repeat-like protein [Mycena sanguinolenta]
MLDFMAADRARLSDLEMQIMHFERLLAPLRAEQARVQEKLNAYKYPVLTLPNEVTGEIFMCFLPAHPDAPPLTGPTSPTTLTQVCRQWRKVALATPMLWRAMLFLDDIPYAQTRCLSEAWIRRSVSCPLVIDVDIDDPEFLLEMFTAPLAMGTAQWERLRIRGSLSSLPKTASAMPMLRSLELVLAAFPSDFLAFYDTPQLRTVLLHGDVASKVTLPWIQLTCLTLNYVWVNDCVQVLAQTPNLVRCVVVVEGGPGPGGVTRVKLALPFLESLVLKNTIRHPTLDGLDQFLDLFVVPALSSLDVEKIFLRVDPIAQFQLLVSTFGCGLQEVCIRGRIGTTYGNQFRQAFPSISTFSFPDAYEDETDEDEYEEDDSDSDYLDESE